MLSPDQVQAVLTESNDVKVMQVYPRTHIADNHSLGSMKKTYQWQKLSMLQYFIGGKYTYCIAVPGDAL